MRDESVWAIEGTIRYFDGTTVAGLHVTADDRDLRKEKLQSECRSGRDGYYRIEYEIKRLDCFEKNSADIVVMVSTTESREVATSPILFNAPPTAVIDVTIPANALLPPSLFERIEQSIKPLLNGVKLRRWNRMENAMVSFFSPGKPVLSTIRWPAPYWHTSWHVVSYLSNYLVRHDVVVEQVARAYPLNAAGPTQASSAG